MTTCIKHATFTRRDGTAGQTWTNYCGVNVYYTIYENGRRVDGGQMPAEDHNPRFANAGATAKFEPAN